MWAGAVVCIGLLAGGIGALASDPLSGARRPGVRNAPCGWDLRRPATYRHVIWIWMENHSYDAVIGSDQAPRTNSLASACGLATNFHNITHPSLPNYIAATSGLGGPELDPFRNDCNPGKTCSTRQRRLFAQLPTWRTYEESMPTPCPRTHSGLYT